jgi:hypothetical protein
MAEMKRREDELQQLEAMQRNIARQVSNPAAGSSLRLLVF